MIRFLFTLVQFLSCKVTSDSMNRIYPTSSRKNQKNKSDDQEPSDLGDKENEMASMVLALDFEGFMKEVSYSTAGEGVKSIECVKW